MFEKMAKAFRSMGMIMASQIPQALGDAWFDLARESDRARQDINQLRSEIDELKKG